MSLSFEVNGSPRTIEIDPATPLLWVLRDTLGLTGTKFGCGAAQCGACTVHVDGRARRSCVTPVFAVTGRSVTTIEGLGGAVGAALERAWIEVDVPQCGYCQPGQLMSAAVLVAENDRPTDEEVGLCMSGNICRCGTYARIRRAIHRAAELKREGGR
jgi:aerobic-type carbon monoxide dehydrogenase small subunit (CoxS/CutS family)